MNEFIIDGYDIKEAFNIKVLSADGLDIIPKVKKRDERSWPEESGVEIDTATDLVFEAQDISLNCYVEEATYADGIKRINGLINLLADNGIHLLGSAIRNRLYPVLLQEVSSYQRRTSTNASRVAITFTVKLICHLPECRMGSAVVIEDIEQVSINANWGKEIMIWWGDGGTSAGVGLLPHTYESPGTRTILIAGTGVTSHIIPVIGSIVIDEYSYPASGDITHVDVSHTSEQTYQALEVEKNALNTTAETDGEISPTLWAWIVSVYAVIVAKSVKSHIIGLWTTIKTLWEERSELYSTTLANAVASVLINVDSQGNAFSLKECEVLILTPSMDNSGVTMLIRTGNHNYTSGGNYNITGFVMAFGGYTSITLTKLIYDSTLKTVLQNTKQHMITGASTSASATYNGFIKNQEKLTPITEISVVSLGVNFPIGTKIVIRNAKRSIN